MTVYGYLTINLIKQEKKITEAKAQAPYSVMLLCKY